jgi:hypothetical protein
MHSLKLLKRDLTVAVSASALAFASALVCGRPFVKIDPAGIAQSYAQQSQFQSAVFLGTVERSGAALFLRASSGQLYKLDGAQPGQALEGRTVRVAGMLDATGMIHVASIYPFAA